MRYGYWLPVFGGWLRNVQDEAMETSWAYVQRLARRSEVLGYDLTLIAELFMNDIKGIDAPSLDAWSTAAALAAVTERLELIVAVRPTFHSPALLAKQAANIDHISNGRLSLNVVSSWWQDEARRYGVHFEEHDDRYARTEDWLQVLDGVWKEPRFSHQGKYYRVDGTILEPKPLVRGYRRRPTLYAGGESEAAKRLISRACDAYVMHGDAPETVAAKIADMQRRRAEWKLPPLQFGMAAYTIVRPTEAEAKRELARITNVQEGSPGYQNYRDWVAHTKLESALSLQDYSVSNRGLRAGLVGTPDQVAERVLAFERAGVDLLLLQCSPQLEEMENFSREVMPRVRDARAAARYVPAA
ncbi:LLM class flavin-dependent oxidoreductase [Aggregicoccus sp. 17bor-14]|uniref:LLM class flavin-dependent oxidoreductase n=1 Tax=Myxococcaceae TaxID=31 RepID=UPI00129C6BE9|nr:MULTISPECIES: LLM class flavin-dependent oxidoreductase [Myxococcaceae]MBF5041601.1 LLM class flavin-dependent oxidoreductase [Simulacricoccus sp. 17bor-14]MRI87386.1 LLM class flavin-dependent oxidoreductase [Aggregicoccus sp. 17bor-14]